MIFKSTSTRQICIFGLIASILFSLAVLFQHNWINQDGILYVGVASLLQNGQFSDAISLYPWPFFSLLIAVFDMVTGVGLDTSAYILVTIFDAALLVAFVLIVKELGGDARVQIAAVVVVFSLAYMNENRADVIRDHGYWCCYLFSLWLYIRFYISPTLWLGLGWSAVILLGALFRVEGLVIWAALPLVILLRQDTSGVMKMRYLSMSYLPHIIIGLIFVSYLWVTKDDMLLATRLKDFKLLFGQLLDGFGVDMERRMSALRAGVLDPRYSSDFAGPSLVGILLVILGSKLITTATIPYLSVFFVPSLRARLKKLDARRVFVLVWASIISLIVVLTVLIPRFYLSARWAQSLALTLLVFVPFMLVRALDHWRTNRSVMRLRTKAVYIIFSLIILYGFLDGLISTSPSKSYIKDAGIWMKNNLDQKSKLYTNEARLDHYSGRYDGNRRRKKLRSDQWYRYDYIAILLKSNDVIDEINSKSDCLTEIKQFSGPRKGMVKVFRVNHDKGCDNKTK